MKGPADTNTFEVSLLETVTVTGAAAGAGSVIANVPD